MATHSWKIPWTEEPGGLQSRGRKELDATEHTPMQPHSHHRSPGSLLRDTCLQFNTCPLYAFLGRYKTSHICISFSVSLISTYSTHFLNLVFQNLHLANHSECTEVQSALVLSSLCALWFLFSVLPKSHSQGGSVLEPYFGCLCFGCFSALSIFLSE